MTAKRTCAETEPASPTGRQAKITDYASTRRSVRLASKSPQDSPAKPNVSKETEGSIVGGLVSAEQAVPEVVAEGVSLVSDVFHDDEPVYSPEKASPTHAAAKQARLESPPKPSVVPFTLTTAKPQFAANTIEDSVLPLPPNFDHILKCFVALDNQCLVALGRSQRRVTYLFVKEAVERSTGRSFPIDILGKINTLWSEAYSYEHTFAVADGKRQPTVFISTLHASTPRALESRRQELRGRLLAFAISLHAKFLEAKGIEIPDPALLINWHPQFDLKACDVHFLPIIKVGEPQIEQPKAGTVSDRVTAAIDAKDAQLLGDIIGNTKTKPSQESPSDVKPILSLRDRVKLKENRSAQDLMTRQKECLNGHLQSLKGLIEPIQTTFLVARKESLPSRLLYTKLVESSRTPTSTIEVSAKVSTLSLAAPTWLAIKDKGLEKEYVRLLDKSMSVRQVEGMIDAYIAVQSQM